MIAAAKESGADIAKFQVFDAEATFGRAGNEWFEYNCRTQLSRSSVEELAAECARVGIEFAASVFDIPRIAWLEGVGVQRYKVASRSIRDEALLGAIAETGKSMVVSLGHWHERDFPRIPGARAVDFLYCVAKYPTPLVDVHLDAVDFTRYAGFSDHTFGITAAMAALARGARIVEKHLTLDRGMEGPDHAVSMTPDELRQLHAFRVECEEFLCPESSRCAVAPIRSSAFAAV